ncbi:O-antigen export system permease protein RfbD [Geminocystis sp. NIES-3708]|uniref:ABC transporter permease n=1 Tax=Geminocystis sp. NIES-3708 TaxID=1615909 RepID=UPI0005FCCF04|nr:ABC transporter permease [Geminocystis sp. NIES-3708]BAQ61799.1 O-antigen export system permease protein RfbD [Geminocystis sp. NIES-3708]
MIFKSLDRLIKLWINFIKNRYLPYFIPWSDRWLLQLFVSRQIQIKYRGSVLGLAWSLLTPLFQLGVYTFVFQYALKLKWTENDGNTFNFALFMLTGLAVFSFFAECVIQAPMLILEQPNLVKKVRFPTEILAWALLISTGFSTLILIGFLLLSCLILGATSITPAWFTLPLIWFPLVPLVLGITWGCSAIGVYFRDLRHIIALFVPLLQFLSPIFYTVSVLPERFQRIIYLNPLTLIIEQSRSAIFSGLYPSWEMWINEISACLVIAILGAILHNRLRRGFADVV